MKEKEMKTKISEIIHSASFKEMVEESKNQRFKSDFKFLNELGGFKTGLYLLMGTTGSGKTTMNRSILTDLVKNNPNAKVMVWLSEESTEEFIVELLKGQL